MTKRCPPAALQSDELALALFEHHSRLKPKKLRTRHLHDDKGPLFVNRLIQEASPYLRQHAYNPVDWRTFNDEAFEEAKRLDRPVFLSVGYSTCHWCHVMEEESFEDLEIATYLNENFISIKVDREERPDVDAVYMGAVVTMTRRGGWPMTCFLNEQREAFFAGTYFCARDNDRGESIGFLTLLKRIKNTYDNERQKSDTHGQQVTAALQKQFAAPQKIEASLDADAIFLAALKRATALYDPQYGGVSAHTKFPSQFPIRFLFRYTQLTGDHHGTDMAAHTLRAMQEGGMHDQLGGGFHRYSTEPTWTVPHFEKMLYDNAQMATLYIEGFQATGDESFKKTACHTLDSLANDMRSKEGGFYAATDADSQTPYLAKDGRYLHLEGYYFTFTPEELARELSPVQFALAQSVFGISDEGNFEGRSIPVRKVPLTTLAKEYDLEEDELSPLIDDLRKQMLLMREERPQPLLDDKIIVAWNGLTISAFAKGARAFDRKDYLECAENAVRYLLEALCKNGRLQRSVHSSVGFLSDYAFLISALLDLFELTANDFYLAKAKSLDEKVLEYFESEQGAYYFSPSDGEKLLVREVPNTDGAEPCANSYCADNLLRLYAITLDEKYRKRARDLFLVFGEQLQKAPLSLSNMLLALMRDHVGARQIVAAGAGVDESEMAAHLRRAFLPHDVLFIDEDFAGSSEALFRDKSGGEARVFVCEEGVCSLASGEVDALKKSLLH